MKIYDCFTFFNEFDILELRLQELWDTVDYFVISEANITHQNAAKPYYLEDNWARFEKYASKIRHIKVDDMPRSAHTWDNERFQRRVLARGLTDLQPEDIVVVSDCDEIPRPEALEMIKTDTNDYDRYILAIPLNYYKINYMMVTPCFKQNNIMVTRGRAFLDPQREREMTFNTSTLPMHFANESLCIIEHGGWHFTYFGDTNHALNKIKSFAHDETDVPQIVDNLDVERMVAKKVGLLGEDYHERFEYITIDDYFPKTITENLDKWSHMIVQGETKNIYEIYPE
jgi:hypothetical protein